MRSSRGGYGDYQSLGAQGDVSLYHHDIRHDIIRDMTVYHDSYHDSYHDMTHDITSDMTVTMMCSCVGRWQVFV